MTDSQNLRKILSQNIRNARLSLYISQAKLAEFAGISVPHMLDIEYCKTWVSEKTLCGIARALNMEAYELLIPDNNEKKIKMKKENKILQKTAELIKIKKKEIRKNSDEVMDNLILDILKLYGE
ncbi:MAG: helix-turn-helix domain-containing protein [Treponema sp.]|nr:helix-turn-helix domain-containing protein [Treponema sp.]